MTNDLPRPQEGVPGKQGGDCASSSEGVRLIEHAYAGPGSFLSEHSQKSKTSLTTEQVKTIELVSESYRKMAVELEKRIVGLKEVIEQLLICIFTGNHALLVGVPGLAKTLLVRSLSELLDLKFSRIQFTPDLMPSDITGTEILMQYSEEEGRHLAFLKGPIFANVVLADEINRTPPKTQAALLEAMEERTVTSIGRRFRLDPPFFVLATQNPIEQEGTYALPAAQLDRFMFNLLLDYPEKREEHDIMRLTVSCDAAPLFPVLSHERILNLLDIVRKVEISDEMIQYAVALTRRSRPSHESAPSFIKDFVAWGVSPRAAQGMIVGGKARAMLQGRYRVSAMDIMSIAHPVMRHRIILNYRAEADGITPDEIIDRLLETTPAPEGSKKSVKTRKYASKLYLSVTNRS